MGAHPAGDGISWDDAEAVDVDRPHGLDYRYVQHVAKGVRKRMGKEHVTFDDATVGGDHIPGGCQVLLRDTTAHFALAGDGTCIKNGIACVTAGDQAGLWYFDDNTEATFAKFTPASICKGGDFTWSGQHEFDTSVDMTLLHVDASFTVAGPAVLDGTTNIHGECDMSNATIDGTLTVLDRADFSSVGILGDLTVTGGAEFDGAVQCDGSVQVNSLMSWGAQNVYDSSWFNLGDGSFATKTHDLSSTACVFWLWFKDIYNQIGEGADRVYQFINCIESGVQRGVQLQNLTTTQVTIQGSPDGIHVCFSTAGGEAYSTCGQYRILGMRLV